MPPGCASFSVHAHGKINIFAVLEDARTRTPRRMATRPMQLNLSAGHHDCHSEFASFPSSSSLHSLSLRIRLYVSSHVTHSSLTLRFLLFPSLTSLSSVSTTALSTQTIVVTARQMRTDQWTVAVTVAVVLRVSLLCSGRRISCKTTSRWIQRATRSVKRGRIAGERYPPPQSQAQALSLLFNRPACTVPYSCCVQSDAGN
jgi:hypothetical protein